MKPLKVFLLLTVFLMPLLGANANFGFEQIKVLFFIVSLSLIGFLWRGEGVRWTAIGKAGGLFILVLALTSLAGIDPKNSFLGTQPYFQGVILYAYLFLFFLIVGWIKIKFKVWAVVLGMSASLVSLLAVKDWIILNILHIPVPTYAGRVVSTFGQPNFYAGFLLLTLPFAYYLRPFGLILGLISIIGIFVSYSRSAILLALLLLILGLIDQLKIKFKIAAVVFGAIFISVILAFIYSSGLIGNEFSNPIATGNPDLTRESVEKRVYIWPQIIKITLQKPLFGYGLENIDKAFRNYFAVNKHPLFEENLNVSPVLLSLKELNLDRTHNYILDLLMFSGIVGVLSWIIVVALLFKKTKQKVLIVSLATYLVWIQFQNQSIVHLIYFWLLAGLIDQNIDKDC